MTEKPRLCITHPARCNRRECQARRNLPKHPALYVHWPKCQVCKEGLMYVDWYRMKRGPKDRAPACTDPTCNFTAEHLAKTGKLVERHRVDNKGCSGYDDYVAERSLISSTHSPTTKDSGGEPNW